MISLGLKRRALALPQPGYEQMRFEGWQERLAKVIDMAE
jgi:hypothetical protein